MRVAFLLALLALVAGCRSNEEAPPAAPPADALVTILGRHLTRAEVEGEEFGSVSAAVLGTLLDRYRAERGIVATDEEIADVLRVFAGLQQKSDAVVATDGERALFEAFQRQMAVDRVVVWKTSKALHEQYGGKVIWQQMNPLEPVGAYLAFLREHEAGGSFQIHDAEAAASFWESFTAENRSWIVKPEKVDFSKPWWLKADGKTGK